MAATHTQFVGSIPEIYEKHLGPLFFRYYADDLAARLDLNRDACVLEIACGTGILTEVLRDTLPDSIRIIATDLNEAMIDFAVKKRGLLVNLDFEQADALSLPYAGQSIDAVLCQFGIMFFPDKFAGLCEAARVLKPGGQLLFSVWDSLQWNPVARVAHEAIGRFFAVDPPTFMLLPFGYHNIDPIKALMLDAGFGDIEISIVRTVVECASFRDVAIGLVEGNPGIHEIRQRAGAAPEVVTQAVAEALRENFGEAPLRAPLQAIVFAARRSPVVSTPRPA